MKINKIRLDDIQRCYCASSININGELHALFASEDPQNVCNAYHGENFENKVNVWDDAGGCMSIIPFENRKNEFLAVQEFYLKVSPSLSKLVWGRYDDTLNKIVFKDLFNLPYLHRFDIYNVDGEEYLVLATIAKSKENKEDWSNPGQIYLAKLPSDLNDPIELKEIATDMFINHGYSKSVYNGKVCGYFSSEQGVLRLTPPTTKGGEWNLEKIMDKKVSDIAFVDIDNDGELEMMTIEPFHGNIIKIYKLVNNEYTEVFKYPTEIDFAHALVGGKVAGINTFIIGIRRVNCELALVQYINNEYKVTIIEEGVGPANVALINRENDDLILSANHTKNEAAIYVVTKGE